MASCAAGSDLTSVTDFVRSVKQSMITIHSGDAKPSVAPHVVIGNEAGDADSILSAIGLSYVKALQSTNDNQLFVPVVSIPAESLKFQRPETTYLLSECAGMENVKADVNDLIAIDQEDLLPKQATLTLSDHNYFKGKQGFDWVVKEILDHHLDEEKHSDTCVKRNIAFEDSKALVASTTTLVAEEYYAAAGDSKMPPSLAILLLGTILIDSINMNPKAGKGTPRDAAILQRLLEETNWGELNLPDEILAIDEDGTKSSAPDPTKLFNKLQDAKFSPEFWNGLTAEQAIRMDFKSFSIPSATSETSSLGLGSILLEMGHFCDKHESSLVNTMAKILQEDQSELLGLMFTTFGPGDQRRRQIVLASHDEPTLEKLLNYLTVDTTTTPNLELEITSRENAKVAIDGDEKSLFIVRMEQGNVAASRKQVAPILMEFFQNSR